MNRKNQIIVYTSDNCAFCDSAKNLLKQKELHYKEINISKDDLLKEEMIKKSNGLMTVPQIFINSKHIGGYDELNNIINANKLNEFIK
jgi:glutaredoxin 3|tara:strand:- start:131 stop:394 length:264 start_codon:yes stop_codon:yes gene_type:complete